MNETIAIKSLIDTNNIYILKLLCELSYLTRDKLFLALKTVCMSAHGFLDIFFVSNLHDLIDEQFGGFDRECDQDIIDWLLAESLTRILFQKFDAERCCRRLIGIGGMVSPEHIARIPKDTFFDYIIDHDTHINIQAIVEAVSGQYDEDISSWIVDRWIMQDDTYSLCDAYHISQTARGKVYFPRIMQRMQDKNMCNAVILCMIWKSFCRDELDVYITDSIYADELLFAIRVALEQHNIDAEVTNELHKMIRHVRDYDITINDCNEILAKLTALLPLADTLSIYLPKN